MFAVVKFSQIKVGERFYADKVWWFKYTELSGWCQERQASKGEEITKQFLLKDQYVGSRSMRVRI